MKTFLLVVGAGCATSIVCAVLFHFWLRTFAPRDPADLSTEE